MRIRSMLAAAALVAAFLGAPDAVRADDLKVTARAVAARSSKAVVTVKLVLKIKMGGREQEQKLEVTGTVIDASGLTVVPASAVEPTGMLNAMRGGRGRGGGGEGGMPNVETEVRETAIILDDGTEVDADVILKDLDLDLAFVRPHEPTKMDAIELKPRGKAPELLEDIFSISRMGRGQNRAPAINVGAIKAVVKGPRPYYLCTAELTAASQGCIAFAADGAPLGIFVAKVNPQAEGGGGGRMGGRGQGNEAVSIVLRPVDEILDLVKQAKEAKAPERKPDEAEAPKEAPKPEGGDVPASPAKPEAPKAPEKAPEAPKAPAAPK